jgi:hypothetical protein
LSGSLLLLGLPAAHRTACGTNSSTNGRPLASIASNGTSDGADGGSSCRTARRAALWRRRRSLLHRLAWIKSGLLFCPLVTRKFILFLLFLCLAFGWLDKHV